MTDTDFNHFDDLMHKILGNVLDVKERLVRTETRLVLLAKAMGHEKILQLEDNE